MNELEVLRSFREDMPEPSTDAWLRARAAIDAARAEELQTSNPPPRRGVTRSRRRVAAVGLVIAIIATTIGVIVARNNEGARTPVTQTNTAVIRARVVDALSVGGNMILDAQSSLESPGHTTVSGEQWNYPWNGQPGQIVRQANSYLVGASLQARSNLTFTVPAESPSTEASGLACNIGAKGVFVDFTSQTWHAYTAQCVALTPDAESAAFIDPKTHHSISDIRTIVADGLLHVVGHPVIDGQRLSSSEPTIRRRTRLHPGSTPIPICQCRRSVRPP